MSLPFGGRLWAKASRGCRRWFAPWYGDRPDNRAYLEEDKKRPDAVATMQADAQGPHEAPIRAGEERDLSWAPVLRPGAYTIRARLIYDLGTTTERSRGTRQRSTDLPCR